MSKEEKMFVSWTDEESKNLAYENTKDRLGVCGSVFKAEGSLFNYIDIEPNKSVRNTFTRRDYDSFRPEEAIPTRQKKIMGLCMSAYDKVGIVRNVIDLMGDFASQGITVTHPDRAIERFGRKWWNKIKGAERSERFLNLLYRIGTVIVERHTAKINKKTETELKKSSAGVEIENVDFTKREIPWRYVFLNPLAVEYKNLKADMFMGKPQMVLKISKQTQSAIESSQYFSTLPINIKNELGKNEILLNPETVKIFSYKKDDWLPWANPMLYAILDDIRMLEKMKLADLAALDGAISTVRLWNLGNLEYKIIPTSAAINKLRDELAGNVGGGTVDLIWGPELSFTESNSQVHNFLGEAKYQPVLTSIYAGLGIPPTLTGTSGSSGGFTNNYVSLKTLIERLEYGRQILTQFWQEELEILQKAMGFRKPFQLHFDNIILSDEVAEKNLLIQLIDRGILSDETILERFNELPNIETVRTRRENRNRDNVPHTSQKASPYHNPQTNDDLTKIAVQNDMVDPEHLNKKGIPTVKREEWTSVKVANKPVPKPAGTGSTTKKKPKKSVNGRPKNAGDKTSRKKKRVLPRSKATLWAINAQREIGDFLVEFGLAHFNKKDVRSFTKAEYEHIERLKLCVLTHAPIFSEITPELIGEALKANTQPSLAFMNRSEALIKDFIAAHSKKPNPEDMRFIYATVLAQMS